MKDVLQEIIAHKQQELDIMKGKKPSLKEALLSSDTGIIAEFKRRSPSKGWIKQEGRADLIPLSYQRNGASAISILTDSHFFGGNDDLGNFLMNLKNMDGFDQTTNLAIVRDS